VKCETTLNWLRARAKIAEIVMSVCNGASLLAAAGILDGRQATTNKLLWKEATEPGPKVNWVKQARWVDLGTIITASGIAAGMDMTHALITRLYGKDVATWLGRVQRVTSQILSNCLFKVAILLVSFLFRIRSRGRYRRSFYWQNHA